MKIRAEIVSSSVRTIVPLINTPIEKKIYIYIPMTEEEKEICAPNIIGACWRISVED